MQKTWILKEPNVALKNSLSKELGSSGLFAQLLINRGIEDIKGAKVFLRSELSDLHDPLMMEGMGRSVARIRQAVVKKEKVFIATDFDVDGVTSCAILETALKRLGLTLAHYLPHRVRDGYGLNRSACRAAFDFGAKLFISLDCGITSINEVAELNRYGLDVIIIDHHEPPQGELPAAFSFASPKDLLTQSDTHTHTLTLSRSLWSLFEL